MDEVIIMLPHKDYDWNWLLELDSYRRWFLENVKVLAWV